MLDPSSNPTDRKEIAEALLAAIEVLDAEFSDTDGSGFDALAKCRRALETLNGLTLNRIPQPLEIGAPFARGSRRTSVWKSS
jgi:hypothetical protein